MKQSVSGLRSNNSCLLPSANDPACQNLSQSFQSSVSTIFFDEKSDQIWSFLLGTRRNTDFLVWMWLLLSHQISSSPIPFYIPILLWRVSCPFCHTFQTLSQESNFWDTSEKQHEFNYTRTFRVDKNNSSFTPLHGIQHRAVTQSSKVEVLHLNETEPAKQSKAYGQKKN